MRRPSRVEYRGVCGQAQGRGRNGSDLSGAALQVSVPGGADDDDKTQRTDYHVTVGNLARDYHEVTTRYTVIRVLCQDGTFAFCVF